MVVSVVVEAIAQGFAQDIGGHDRKEQAQPRQDDQHGLGEDELPRIGDHHTPFGRRCFRLDMTNWSAVLVNSVERLANGPDGQTATVSDNVIFLRRNPQ